jgi:Xaa-Pro aminopeptidase
MKTKGIHAYLIPTEDPHQSEYIANFHQRRSFISGFTGSAGTAIVTLDKAALWTDGRYYLQASQQLSSDWILQKHGLKETPSQEAWLLSVLQKGSKVGIDPELITFSRSETLKKDLEDNGHSLVSLNENLVDLVWNDRPNAPESPIFVHDVRYAGEPFDSKVKKIQQELVKGKYWGLVVSALDEIAWLLNLRGADIQFNPVFLSYVLVTPDQVYLYVDQSKVNSEIRSHLNGVVIKAYNDIFFDLESLSSKKQNSLLLDKRASLKLVSCIKSEYEFQRNPIQTAKSIKNAVELQGFRECHKRDAAALCRYFSWLENELVNNGRKDLTEAQAADKLEEFRRY